MRPKRYPYSKKMKKQYPSSIFHEIELIGNNIIVDEKIFECADFNISPSYESVKVSLEFYAKIKASGNAG